MSLKHPIISVTGSSGAGTSTVKTTFDQIFRREGIKSVSIEGDAFHKFNRADMKSELEERLAAGDHSFSHFSLEANELGELERIFREYGETGKGRTRVYVHSDAEAETLGVPSGNFTEWSDFEENSDILFYEGLSHRWAFFIWTGFKYSDIRQRLPRSLRLLAMTQGEASTFNKKLCSSYRWKRNN